MEGKKSPKGKNRHEADNRTDEVDAAGLPTTTTLVDEVPRKRQRKSDLVLGAGRPEPLEGTSDAGGSVLRVFKPVDQHQQRHHKYKQKHKRKDKRDLSSLSQETDAGTSEVTEAYTHPGPRTIHKHKHRHRHEYRKQSQSSTVDSSQEQSEGRGRHRRRHRNRRRESTEEAESAMDDRMGSTLQVEGAEGLSEQQLAEFHNTEDQYSALHCQWVRSTPENRERLREKVGKWKTGRWSVQEVNTLKRNVRVFLKDYGIRSPSSIIFSDRSEKKAALYRYMAKDIKRPLFNIYRKMVRVFNIEHFVGKWTPEMEQKLLSLHRLHGNRWKAIGLTMGISSSAALSKYKILRRKQRGPWSHEEEERLVEAMRQFQTEQEGGVVLDTEDLPDTIRWEDVAQQVGTRTHHQCRQKWVLHLCWKQKGGRDQWTFQDDLKMIRVLSSLDEEDEEGVEWGQLCGGWSSARSASFLRGKWASLRRDVPNYRIRTFQDNVEWLLEHKAPVLQRRQKALEKEQILTSEESD